MLEVGDYVRVVVDYPKNRRLSGEYEGTVTKVGQYMSGFVYFKLDSTAAALPLSRKYRVVLERKRGGGKEVAA